MGLGRFKVKLIEPALFLYVLGLFFMIPVEQQLVLRKVCVAHYNHSFCHTNANVQKSHATENVLQEKAAKWDIYLNIARMLPSIVATLFFGAWSDNVGRKKILCAAMLGETLNAICYLVNAIYTPAHVGYLLIGNVVNGMLGNHPAVMLSVFSYIADVTTQETRTTRIAIVDGLTHISQIVSSLGSGWMLQQLGFAPVYMLVLALYGTLSLYVIFFLKESYTPTDEARARSGNILQQLQGSLRLFTWNRAPYYRAKMLMFVACFFVLFFQIIGMGSVIVFFLLHHPLDFLPKEIGYFFALTNGVKFIGILITAGLFVRVLKWRDSSLVLMSATISIFCSLFLGLSKKNWHVYLTAILSIGVGIGNSACRSGLSKLVSPEEQGKMSSVIANMQGISLLMASIVCNYIYKATVHISPSITFYCISGFTVIAVAFAVLLKYFEYASGDTVGNIGRVDVHLEDIDEVALLTDDEEDLDGGFAGAVAVLSAYDIAAPESSGDDVGYDVRHVSDIVRDVGGNGQELQEFA